MISISLHVHAERSKQIKLISRADFGSLNI